MRHTTVRCVQLLCFAFCVVAATSEAHAQGNPIESAVTHMGFGVGWDVYFPSADRGETSKGVSLVYRWHTFRSGWGPTFGLDWHSTDFNEPLGSVDTPLGSLRMRALLAGFGHTTRIGRYAVSANATAGWSFNDFSVDRGAPPAFANAGTPLLGVSVDNGWIVKPHLSVWYDVARHVGVGVTAAYLIARPEETITTTAGSTVRDLRADAFEITVGVTFGVWKKR